MQSASKNDRLPAAEPGDQFNLADHDRPPVEYQPDCWPGVTLELRELPALVWMELVENYPEVQNRGTDDPLTALMVRFFSEVCAAGVTSPPITPRQWENASRAALLEIGTKVLDVSGMLQKNVDEKKSDSAGSPC